MGSQNRRTIWIVLLALWALGSSLGACGLTGQEEAPPGSTQVPAGTPAPAATPEPTATPTPTPTPLPTATPTPNPAFPMGTTHFSFGINAHLYYPEVVGRTYDDILWYVDDLGIEWVRQQVSWADIEAAPGEYHWDELDRVVEAVGRHNRKLMVSIVRAPSWATEDGSHGMPADPNTLGDFLYAMATRYQGRIQAYEIWNEQNYAVENGGYVAGAGRYVELLRVAFTRIKEADQHAVVLFGPLTPTGVNDPTIAIDDIAYLRQVYEYQDGVVRGYFDVLGAHVAGSNNPPDTLWPDNPGPDGWTDHPSHYFRHVENLRAVMEAYGDADKQIWITEFGWASIEGIIDSSAPGYEYAAQNSALAQGDYLVWAMVIGRNDYQPWLGAMFIWNLNFATFNPPDDEKSAFSLLRPDWGTRPSYRAVRDFVNQRSEWP